MTQWNPDWQPVLTSSIAVVGIRLVTSCVCTRFCPVRKELPDEETTVAQLQKSGAGPGLYGFPIPGAGMEQNAREKIDRLESGPWGTVNVFAGPVRPLRLLSYLWLYALLTSWWISAGVTTVMQSGPEFQATFQAAGFLGLLTYAWGPVYRSVSPGFHLRSELPSLVEGLTCGLVTGLVFALWRS